MLQRCTQHIRTVNVSPSCTTYRYSILQLTACSKNKRLYMYIKANHCMQHWNSFPIKILDVQSIFIIYQEACAF